MKEVIKTTSPHGHKDYLEIVYLEEGAGVHQIDMQRFDVKPGSLYLIMPGQIHCWELTEIPKGFVIMVQKEFLLGQPFYEALFQTFPLAFGSNYDMSKYHQNILYIFNSIQKEYADKLAGFQSVVQTYLQLLFQWVKREMPPENAVPAPIVLKEFFTLLDKEYRTSREVNSFAIKLGVSVRTLNNVCKKYLNRTVGEVIIDKIIVENKKLLLYTDINITSLAYEFGFSDPSHFNKYFKRHAGVLPSQYRKGIS